MGVAGVAPDSIATERLVGRRLTPADESLFLAFHRDPRVVSWLGGGKREISEQENREWLDEKLRHWEIHGFGLYALFELVAPDGPSIAPPPHAAPPHAASAAAAPLQPPSPLSVPPGRFVAAPASIRSTRTSARWWATPRRSS